MLAQSPLPPPSLLFHHWYMSVLVDVHTQWRGKIKMKSNEYFNVKVRYDISLHCDANEQGE